jgi:hypothetical protein
MPFPCHSLPLRVYIVPFTFDLHSAAVFDSHMPFRARAMPQTCRSESDFSRPRQSAAWAWHVWISIGRPETACGRPARVRLLPANTWSSGKVATNSLNYRTSSSDISDCHADFQEGHGTVGDWQGRGMGVTWHVWISLKRVIYISFSVKQIQIRLNNAKTVHSAGRERWAYTHARLLEQSVPLHADSNVRTVTSYRRFTREWEKKHTSRHQFTVRQQKDYLGRKNKIYIATIEFNS